MRAKALFLAEEKEQAENKVRLAEHKSKVSSLAIFKIIRTKHQNRAWLLLLLSCM